MLLWLIPLALALDPSKVKYAINCGGSEIVTSDGVRYKSDSGFSAGVASDHGKSSSIKLTSTPELYQTERYATSDFTYTVPLPEPGKYVLILKFSEVWFTSEQQKIFSVEIGDQTVVEFLDIYSKVGIFAAYDEFIPFVYQKGKVLIDGSEVKNAVKGEKLVIKFVKTDFDNPKINAIVLLNGGLDDTDYAKQKKFLQGLKKEKEEDEKRFESKKPAKVFEDESDFEDLDVEHEIIIEENNSLLGVLSSIPALIIISLVLVLGVAACIPSKPSLHVPPAVQPKKRN